MSGIAHARAGADLDRNTLPPPSPHPQVPKRGVLFFDDFQRDTIGPRWTFDRSGVWSIRRGMLRADLPDRKQQRSFIRAGSTKWTDYAVDLDMCMMRGVDKGVVVRASGDEGMAVDLRGPGYGDVLLHIGRRSIGKASVINGNAMWHHLRVEARGDTYTVYVDGDQTLEVRDSRESLTNGHIVLPAYTGGVGACTVYYDNVLVTLLE
jgi:hypothetical protein